MNEYYQEEVVTKTVRTYNTQKMIEKIQEYFDSIDYPVKVFHVRVESTRPYMAYFSFMYIDDDGMSYDVDEDFIEPDGFEKSMLNLAKEFGVDYLSVPYDYYSK